MSSNSSFIYPPNQSGHINIQECLAAQIATAMVLKWDKNWPGFQQIQLPVISEIKAPNIYSIPYKKYQST